MQIVLQSHIKLLGWEELHILHLVTCYSVLVQSINHKYFLIIGKYQIMHPFKVYI